MTMVHLITVGSILAISAITLDSAFVKVGAYEKKVLTVLGENEQVLEPGLNVVPPFISNTYAYDMRSQEITREESAHTRDGVEVSVSYEGKYQIHEPKVTHMNSSDHERDVEKLVEESVTEVIYNLQDGYTSTDIETKTKKKADENLSDIGISLVEFTVTDINDKKQETQEDSEYEFW